LGSTAVALCLWFVLLLVCFVPIERFFAPIRTPVRRPGFAADVAYFFIGGIVPKLLLVIPLSLATSAVHQLVPVEFYAAVAEWPIGLRVVAALVVGDFGAYWAHRWVHDIPLLWRFHAIHHSAEQIDWLVNSRGHPIDLTFTRLCSLVPIYALGLAQPMHSGYDLVPVLVVVIGTFWGFFIHANVSWRFGPVEQFVSTPAFHHWHHANDSPQTIYQNFAPLFPWIDRLFGTLYLPRRQWPSRYGIDSPIPSSLTRQLVEPFYVSVPVPEPEPKQVG
jgi:sterol desaturase/sphingolipid hydroxylase (fatty acid hydroxylase superfamily)